MRRAARFRVTVLLNRGQEVARNGPSRQHAGGTTRWMLSRGCPVSVNQPPLCPLGAVHRHVAAGRFRKREHSTSDSARNHQSYPQPYRLEVTQSTFVAGTPTICLDRCRWKVGCSCGPLGTLPATRTRIAQHTIHQSASQICSLG